jgi:hypothetical protein
MKISQSCIDACLACLTSCESCITVPCVRDLKQEAPNLVNSYTHYALKFAKRVLLNVANMHLI